MKWPPSRSAVSTRSQLEMEWGKQSEVIALSLWIPCRGGRLGGNEPGNHILSRKKLSVLTLEEKVAALKIQ